MMEFIEKLELMEKKLSLTEEFDFQPAPKRPGWIRVKKSSRMVCDLMFNTPRIIIGEDIFTALSDIGGIACSVSNVRKKEETKRLLQTLKQGWKIKVPEENNEHY